MPHGLFEVPVVMLMRTATSTADVRPLIGVAAAFLAAVLAAYATWHATDRILSWRRRADQDEF